MVAGQRPAAGERARGYLTLRRVHSPVAAIAWTEPIRAPAGHAHEAFTDDGRLEDPELRARYLEILDEVVSLAEQAEDAVRGAHSG